MTAPLYDLPAWSCGRPRSGRPDPGSRELREPEHSTLDPAPPPPVPRQILVAMGTRLLERAAALGGRLDAGEDVWNKYLETITAVESVANAQHLGLASPSDPAAWERVGREFTRVARLANRARARGQAFDDDPLPVSGSVDPQTFWSRREE
jgi:hypothetical protein